MSEVKTCQLCEYDTHYRNSHCAGCCDTGPAQHEHFSPKKCDNCLFPHLQKTCPSPEGAICSYDSKPPLKYWRPISEEPKSMIERLKDKELIKPFKDLSPEERACLRIANEKSDAVLLYDCSRWREGHWKFNCPELKYCLKFDYQPEKPKELKKITEKPKEPNNPCSDCDRSFRYGDDCTAKGFLCGDNNTGWIPVGSRNKLKETKEKGLQSRAETIAGYKYAGENIAIGDQPLFDFQVDAIKEIFYRKHFNSTYKPNLSKEKVMWNKVAHTIRMFVLVSCLIGIYTIGSFVNPKLIWVADMVKPLADKAVQLESGETVMMKMSYGDRIMTDRGFDDTFTVWFVLALAIAAVIVIPYLLHVATLKLFNVRKK